AGVGVGADTLGRTASCAVALDVTLTVWLPRIGVRNGVSSGTEPVTRTVTEWPRASLQGDGLETSEMFDEVIVVDAPTDSVRTAHTTRLVSALHGAPAWNEVGCTDASRAPARAAVSSETWVLKTRARSPAPTRIRSITGRTSATSTRAWPRDRPRRSRSRPTRRAAGCRDLGFMVSFRAGCRSRPTRGMRCGIGSERRGRRGRIRPV